MHKERDFIERLIQGKKIEKYVTKKLNKKIKNIIIVDDKFNELWKNKLVFKYVSLDKQQRERKYYEELAKYNKKNGDIWIEGTNSTIKIDVKTVKRSGIKDYKGEISESSILGFKGKYFLFATDNENPKMWFLKAEYIRTMWNNPDNKYFKITMESSDPGLRIFINKIHESISYKKFIDIEKIESGIQIK